MHNSDLNPVRNGISNGIKKKIMRRVYIIWFFRKVTSPVFVETLIFVVILFASTFYISFFDVARNAFNSSASLVSLFQYFLNSFLITDLLSKFLLMAMFVVFFVLNWELFKKRSPAMLRI